MRGSEDGSGKRVEDGGNKGERRREGGMRKGKKGGGEGEVGEEKKVDWEMEVIGRTRMDVL